MLSQLEQLKQFSTIVADTGDFESITKFQPQDATTNPRLLVQAANMPKYQHLVNNAVRFGQQMHEKWKLSEASTMAQVIDKLGVNFGVEILKIVPGYVSTELDPRLSFDAAETVKRARHIVQLYEQAGIDKRRVLIKIPSTWEGLQACRELQREGIQCNMTLLFGLPQAIVAADAQATLISPIVGRIRDWYLARQPDAKEFSPQDDPGVAVAKEIFHYYKKFGIQTIVMGASFRSVDQILALAGYDRLTIGPQYLEQLAQNNHDKVERRLSANHAASPIKGERRHLNEQQFRWRMNEDAMASEQLAEGIRKFTSNLIELETLLKKKLHFLREWC